MNSSLPLAIVESDLVSPAEARFCQLSRTAAATDHTWTTALEVAGAVDPGRLTAAWHRFVARHEICRTTFVAQGDRVDRAVSEDWRETGPIEVVRCADRAAAVAACESLVESDRKVVASVDARPTIVCRLIQIDGEPKASWIVVTAHSICLDQWSTGILWRDLQALYTGADADLPLLRTTPSEIARRWREQTDSATRDKIAARVRDCLPQANSGDRGNDEVAEFSGSRPRELSAGSASEFITLLVDFVQGWAAGCDRRSLLVATASSLRTPETQDALGYYTNRILVPVPDASAPRDELLRSVQGSVYAQLGGRVVFEDLIAEHFPQTYLDPAPVADALFVMADRASVNKEFGGLPARELDVNRRLRRFSVLCSALPQGDRISVRLTYRRVCASQARTLARFLALNPQEIPQ